ncbi:MAG: hypothetical protein WBD83_27240, partial [Xanthobacteraceae bacterium]
GSGRDFLTIAPNSHQIGITAPQDDELFLHRAGKRLGTFRPPTKLVVRMSAKGMLWGAAANKKNCR